jgi:hypothetical protein
MSMKLWNGTTKTKMVKRKLDPMRIVEIANNRYLYRCEACGAESPTTPVVPDKLDLAPEHDCPHSDRLDIAEILEAQDEPVNARNEQE